MGCSVQHTHRYLGDRMWDNCYTYASGQACDIFLAYLRPKRLWNRRVFKHCESCSDIVFLTHIPTCDRGDRNRSKKWKSSERRKKKRKTDLHGLLMLFLWLRCIIKAFLKIIVLLLQACFLEIYLVCKIWSTLCQNWLQQRLILYGTPVSHHDLVKFLYHRVVRNDKRSGLQKTRSRTVIGFSCLIVGGNEPNTTQLNN